MSKDSNSVRLLDRLQNLLEGRVGRFDQTAAAGVGKQLSIQLTVDGGIVAQIQQCLHDVDFVDGVAGGGVAQDVLAGDRIQAGNLLNHLLTGDAPLLEGARQQSCQPVGLERQIT